MHERRDAALGPETGDIVSVEIIYLAVECHRGGVLDVRPRPCDDPLWHKIHRFRRLTAQPFQGLPSSADRYVTLVVFSRGTTQVSPRRQASCTRGSPIHRANVDQMTERPRTTGRRRRPKGAHHGMP